MFFHVSWPTAKRWADRYAAMGVVGMQDRSSRPHRSPNKTSPELVRRVVHLRWKKRLGPVAIGGKLAMPSSTVHAVLVRSRLHRLRHVDIGTRTQGWGTRDIPVAGDFSGDGRTDFAVWRPSDGIWYVMDAATGVTRTQQWGTRGDIPVTGDFSGDGRTDFAVWRPSDGVWYVMDAATGTTRTQQWGTRGDHPA